METSSAIHLGGTEPWQTTSADTGTEVLGAMPCLLVIVADGQPSLPLVRQDGQKEE